MKMYGTECMAKSLTYTWALLGTKPYYGVDLESHRRILTQLACLVDEKKIKCHLKKRLPLDLNGVREAHKLIEAGGSIGKIGLSVDVEGAGAWSGEMFT